MPAAPTSTSDWLPVLQRAAARTAVLELSPAEPSDSTRPRIVARDDGSLEASHHVQWRVRLLKIEGSTLIIERPFSTHHPVATRPGENVVALIAEGPTRWSLTMNVLEQFSYQLNAQQNIIAWRLAWPHEVSNAQRRNYFRVDTAAVVIPPVGVWRLQRADSAVEFERYNQMVHKPNGRPIEEIPRPHFPQITDHFNARMLDLSGGGVCLSAPATLKPLMETNPLLWLRLGLPGLMEPYYATAKIAHFHVESPLIMHLGLAFTFEHHPAHGKFIADELCRFATHIQRMQLQRTR